MRAELVAFALMVLVLVASGRAHAQVAPVALPGGIDLVVPATLRSAAAPPEAHGLVGLLPQVYTDGKEPPVVLWLQVGPRPAVASLPAASSAAALGIARGFAASVPGAHDVGAGGYDPSRGMLALRLETRASRVHGLLAQPDSHSFWSSDVPKAGGDPKVVRCLLAQLLGGALGVTEFALRANYARAASTCGLSEHAVATFVAATGAAEFAEVTSYLSGVAFMTKSATLLALVAAPSARAPDADAVASLIWKHSRVLPEAMLPFDGAPGSPFGVGRFIGVVLGSFIAALLVLALAHGVLLKLKTKPVITSGVSLALPLVLVLVALGRSGVSLDTLLQFASYVIASAVAYGPLRGWLRAGRGRALLADQRGLSTVEYAVIAVLLVAVGIAGWQAFGAGLRQSLSSGEEQVFNALDTALDARSDGTGAGVNAQGTGVGVNAQGTGVGVNARGTGAGSGSGSTGTAARVTGAGSQVANSSGGAAPPPAAGATPAQAAPAADNAAANDALAAAASDPRDPAEADPGAAPPGPPASEPGIVDSAVEYVRESSAVQTGLGVVYGTLQSLAPGGFIMPSPWSSSQSFEVGRGVGQVATGVVQVVTGVGMMGGGGTAAAGGVVAAPASGGGSLIVTAGGAAVATEGALVTAQGATNVLAGVNTLAMAANNSGSGSGASPPAGGGGGSGGLPPTTEASVADKLDRYLLNPTHPIGGPKAKWFKEALGFDRGNAPQLGRQIVFDPAKAVETGVTQHGTKFNQVIPITGANGRTIDVTFAWIRNNDGVVRLVTAIPTPK